MKYCEECGSPIPRGEEAYKKGKTICQTCYGKNSKMPRNGTKQKEYDKWMGNDKEKEKDDKYEIVDILMDNTGEEEDD